MTLNGMMLLKDLFALVSQRVLWLAPGFNRVCYQMTKEVGAGQRVCSGVKMKKG